MRGQMAMAVVAIIGLIGAIVATTVMANMVNPVTVTGETWTASLNSWVSLQNDNLVVDSETVKTCDGSVVFTKDVNYHIDYVNGDINAYDGFTDGQQYCIDYQYYDDTYITDSGTRAMVQLLPFALGAAVIFIILRGAIV